MSKGSLKVKNWRKRTKRKLVELAGGKCSKCGYNKCIDALEFHHIDPSEKELRVSQPNPIAFAKLAEEIKKCILVCANCHREIHAELRVN